MSKSDKLPPRMAAVTRLPPVRRLPGSGMAPQGISPTGGAAPAAGGASAPVGVQVDTVSFVPPVRQQPAETPAQSPMPTGQRVGEPSAEPSSEATAPAQVPSRTESQLVERSDQAALPPSTPALPTPPASQAGTLEEIVTLQEEARRLQTWRRTRRDMRRATLPIPSFDVLPVEYAILRNAVAAVQQFARADAAVPDALILRSGIHLLGRLDADSPVLRQAVQSAVSVDPRYAPRSVSSTGLTVVDIGSEAAVQALNLEKVGARRAAGQGFERLALAVRIHANDRAIFECAFSRVQEHVKSRRPTNAFVGRVALHVIPLAQVAAPDKLGAAVVSAIGADTRRLV